MATGSTAAPGPIDAGVLPAAHRLWGTGKDKGGFVLVLPSKHLESFLESDLCTKRINNISSYLWAVGRPHLPRSLSTQGVLEPLVPTLLDFKLAKDAGLFREDYEWTDWQTLVSNTLEDYPGDTIHNHIPPRYKYGELRLGRLNKIYRLIRGEWLYGYSSLFGAQTYGGFISEHTVAITTTTVYLVVVLSAMQLGMATSANALIGDSTFRRACYGFAIFAILSPVITAGLVVIVACFLFFVNWFRTRRHGQQVNKARAAPASP
ncbi:uncharacterized protein LTR77_004672 [Saxophila tyrrhenica]|uniref:Uncharacterized protein n=1 Tax=Saxophila tyrrhenica TaxID=1690608 RepID=A0AAV9PDX7_9PEZI|nr:hypothetical protein LTR77_004672 [Saxophila tyrrhenica]